MKIPWTSYLVMGVILGFITLTIIITTLHAIPAISTKMKDTSQLRYLNMFAFQNTRTVFNKSGDIKFLHGIKGFCFIIVVVGKSLNIQHTSKYRQLKQLLFSISTAFIWQKHLFLQQYFYLISMQLMFSYILEDSYQAIIFLEDI